ncbi:MAG: hypothetical protein HYV02_01155 [Deltaproteobacteria bacterium]|nr:hypothetical protein [Deltaproteobacteria bacterium]
MPRVRPPTTVRAGLNFRGTTGKAAAVSSGPGLPAAVGDIAIAALGAQSAASAARWGATPGPMLASQLRQAGEPAHLVAAREVECLMVEIRHRTGFGDPAHQIILDSPHLPHQHLTLWHGLTDPGEATWAAWVEHGKRLDNALQQGPEPQGIDPLLEALYELGVRFEYTTPLSHIEMMNDAEMLALMQQMIQDGLPEPMARTPGAHVAQGAPRQWIASAALTMFRLIVVRGRDDRLYAFPPQLARLDALVRLLIRKAGLEIESAFEQMTELICGHMENARVNRLETVPESYVSAFTLTVRHALTDGVIDGRTIMKLLEKRHGFRTIAEWAVKFTTLQGHVYYYVDPCRFAKSVGTHVMTSLSSMQDLVAALKSPVVEARLAAIAGPSRYYAVSGYGGYGKSCRISGIEVSPISADRNEWMREFRKKHHQCAIIDTRERGPDRLARVKSLLMAAVWDNIDLTNIGAPEAMSRLEAHIWTTGRGLEYSLAQYQGENRSRIGQYGPATFVADLKNGGHLRSAWHRMFPLKPIPAMVRIEFVDKSRRIGAIRIVAGSVQPLAMPAGRGQITLQIDEGSRAPTLLHHSARVDTIAIWDEIDLHSVGQAKGISRLAAQIWATRRDVVQGLTQYKQQYETVIGSYLVHSFVADLQEAAQLATAWAMAFPGISIPSAIRVQWTNAPLQMIGKIRFSDATTLGSPLKKHEGELSVQRTDGRYVIPPSTVSGYGREEILAALS